MPRRDYHLEFATPQTFSEHVEAFFAAVDFSEPLIIVTLGFHMLMLLLVIKTRDYIKVQYFIFMGLLGLCLYLQQFNIYMNENWSKYATQNYFDEQGAFVSLFYGMPILAICVLIIVRGM
jgi:hypothetical protein